MRHVIKLALFCLAVSSQVLAADYRFTRIDVPGSVATEARGINARGDIVGNYLDADDVSHGFLLHKNEYSTIDPPDAVFTTAFAINARGDIAGTFVDGDDVQHGFLLRDGQFTRLDYPESIATTGFGINNAGDITGTFVAADEEGRGYILKDGEFQRVQYSGSADVQVHSAQDNGKVLVGQLTRRSDGSVHGFVSFKPGQVQLIDFPGLAVPCTGVRRINQRGDIVGAFAVVDSVEDCGPPFHAFLLREGEFTQIDAPNATSTRALGVNDDGVIVGSLVDPRDRVHGFKAVPVN